MCYSLNDCEHDASGHLFCKSGTFAGPDCEGYRLPSEAEFELASGTSSDKCLPFGPAVTSDAFPGDDFPVYDLAYEYAWVLYHCAATYDGADHMSYGNEKYCGLHPVGSLLPNAFGLYDTIGNAREWVGTLEQINSLTSQTDFSPIWIDPGYDKVITNGLGVKGGCHSCSLYFASPGNAVPILLSHPNRLTVSSSPGFRLARTGW